MSIATSREEPLLLEMIQFVLVLVWLFTHNQSNIYSSNRLVFSCDSSSRRALVPSSVTYL